MREIGFRGVQKLARISSQISPPKVPSDSAFYKLLDSKLFNGRPIDAESVSKVFKKISAERFLHVFREIEKSGATFQKQFAGHSVDSLIERAERVVDGRFDVLGHAGLSFGTPIEWRRDPISGISSDLKHWSHFDELSRDETGDKKTIWEVNRHQHFFALGVAYILTNREHYAQTFAEHVEGWMEQNPPELGVNWMSSLEVSLRAISWIWALNLFQCSLSVTPELRLKMLKFLYLHGRHIEDHLSVYYSPNTHLTGEALGLYYLGTQLGFLKCADRWREKGEEILLRELNRQILSDGVYFEQSFWYQRYTADFYTHFYLLREIFSAGRHDDAQSKIASKVEAMSEFLLHVMRPDGTTPMVGDDDGGRSLPLGSSRSDDFRGVLSTSAALFSRGDFKYGAGQFLEESFWLLGERGISDYERITAVSPSRSSIGFKDGGYFVMRDGHAETANFMLIDCGELGALSGAHGHADALSFELAVAGRTAIIDSGAYTYHESEDLRNYFRGTGAHNTLVIDGESQSVPGNKFNWESKASCRPMNWISEERFDFFEGSHDGYERLESPVTHTRGILFIKNDYWVIHDFAATRGNHEYALNFQFNPGCTPSVRRLENGDWGVEQASREGDGLRLVTFGDNGAWNQKESWISRNHGERFNASSMRYASAGTGPQEFFTFMLPLEQGVRGPEVRESFAAGGRTFEISFRGYDDVFAYCDTVMGVVFRNVKTDFRVSWARFNASGMPEEIILVDGRRLNVDGRSIIDSPNPLAFASVCILGNQIEVRTSVNVYSIELADKN